METKTPISQLLGKEFKVLSFDDIYRIESINRNNEVTVSWGNLRNKNSTEYPVEKVQEFFENDEWKILN